MPEPDPTAAAFALADRPMSPDAASRTPWLEIDAPRLERNLARMQHIANRAGVALRPHVKTHKSVEIARRQIALGAAGLTASKPSEAQVFVDAGFTDVTLAYPVAVPEALDDLLASAQHRQARLACIAADLRAVGVLERAALRHDYPLLVFLKVDVGLRRIGVRPDDPTALAIVRAVHGSNHLAFAGLLSHAGHAYAARTGEEIRRIAEAEVRDLRALAARIGAEGIPVPCLSIGATPTALGAPLMGGMHEIRPGNYAFLDLTAVRLGLCNIDDLALSVLARVVAVNDEFAIVDAGSKALSSDKGPHGTGGSGFGFASWSRKGEVPTFLPVEKLSEEHGFVRHADDPPDVGTLVRIFPNHACALPVLFERYVRSRLDGSYEFIGIEGRGKLT